MNKTLDKLVGIAITVLVVVLIINGLISLVAPFMGIILIVLGLIGGIVVVLWIAHKTGVDQIFKR